MNPRLSPPDALGWAARSSLAVGITALFGAIMIQQSLLQGELALPATYDDISYFNDGARYLLRFYEGGFRAVGQAFVATPPHSPLSTGLAFVSYSVFGIENWAGPAANVAVLSLFSAAFLMVARPLPIGQGLLLLVALLGSPWASLTVLWYRPDMFSALLTATAMLFVVLRPNWLTDRTDQVVAGILLGAALWAKPTVFHLTIVLVGAAMVLAALQALSRGHIGLAVRAAMLTLAVGLLVASPYYVLALPRIIEYIWTTVYGSEANIWVQPLPVRDHILFYLTGYYGTISLGSWLQAGAVLGLAGLILAAVRGSASRRRGALLALAVVALTYAAVTVPSFKGPHGFPFAAAFMLSAAIASVVVAQELPRPAAWVFCAGLAAFSVWQWDWNYARMRRPLTPEHAAARRDMMHQAYEAVGKPAPGAQFLLTTSANYLNPYSISFEFLKRGLRPPDIVDLQRIGDLSEHRRAVTNADLVFALTPDMGDVIPNLPTASPEFRAEVIKAIEGSGRFSEPVRIRSPDSGEALIYTARDLPAFTTFADESNLGAITGPFPHWNLPRVRWGNGQRSILVTRGSPGASGLLAISAIAQIAGQELRVRVNGALGAQIPLTGTFQNVDVAFHYDEDGKATIELTYGIPSDNAVLFRTLAIR